MSDGHRILIVEDDELFARTLARSLERRGHVVRHARSFAEMDSLLTSFRPERAIVDLRVGTDSGLACVTRIHAADADTRIVVLTGFASIATAVEAVKLGAINYIAKPANTDEIEAAFDASTTGDVGLDMAAPPTSLRTVEWEHIHHMLAACNFNVSETARRLGMHRRTLARKLGKRHLL